MKVKSELWAIDYKLRWGNPQKCKSTEIFGELPEAFSTEVEYVAEEKTELTRSGVQHTIRYKGQLYKEARFVDSYCLNWKNKFYSALELHLGLWKEIMRYQYNVDKEEEKRDALSLFKSDCASSLVVDGVLYYRCEGSLAA